MVIENTGFLLILHLFISMQMLAVFVVMKKVKKRCKPLRKWAKEKNKSFYWSGAIDF